MNGFADHPGLSEVDFDDKKGVSMKTFDAFRMCNLAQYNSTRPATDRSFSQRKRNLPTSHERDRADHGRWPSSWPVFC